MHMLQFHSNSSIFVMFLFHSINNSRSTPHRHLRDFGRGASIEGHKQLLPIGFGLHNESAAAWFHHVFWVFIFAKV
jgi:hypothetical protein